MSNFSATTEWIFLNLCYQHILWLPHKSVHLHTRKSTKCECPCFDMEICTVATKYVGSIILKFGKDPFRGSWVNNVLLTLYVSFSSHSTVINDSLFTNSVNMQWNFHQIAFPIRLFLTTEFWYFLNLILLNNSKWLMQI